MIAEEPSEAVAVLVGVAGFAVLAWWSRKSAEHRQQQAAMEYERRMLREQYDYLSKFANDIILLLDERGNIVEANDRAMVCYGFTVEELLGLNIRDLRDHDLIDEFEDQMRQVRNRNGYVFESIQRRKSGSAFPVEISSRAIEINGKYFFQNIIRDITERRQAQQRIEHLTRLYAVLSQINQAIVRTQSQPTLFQEICRIVVAVGAFKMAWIGLADPSSGTVLPAAHSGMEDRVLEEIRSSLAGEPEHRCPTANAVLTGTHQVHNDIQNDPLVEPYRARAAKSGCRSIASFPLRMNGPVIGALSLYSAEPNFFNQDEINLLDEVTKDISFALEKMDAEIRRKKAEAALIQERNRFAAIIAALGDGISIQDSDFKVLYQNDRHREMSGGDHVGEYCYEAYEHRDTACEGCPVAASFADGRVHTAERSNTVNGRPQTIEIASSSLRDEEGRIIAGIEAVRDTTERRKMEQSLEASEKRYRLLVNSITDYIYTVNVEDGRPVRTVHGPGCLTVTGYSPDEYDVDGALWFKIIHGEDRAKVVEHAGKIMSGQPVSHFEHRIVHKNGSVRWIRNTPVPRFDAEGKLIDYDGLISDITPIKQLEAQLRQAQKMEAVGQLAGGIAHDFNNILTAIIGYGNLLMMKLPPGEDLRGYVEQILGSSERAAHLTHSLLAFSRKQIMDLKPIDINTIIRRVERLLQRLIGEDIELRTALSEGTLSVMADSVQVEQTLMNLVTNARDAMPEGGSILIETARFEMGEDFQREHLYGTPGHYAMIAVTDTGTGMDEKTRLKIFEPFFTTKELGRGTGLGLAMVYGIVKQHGGYINVYSEPGKGSTFKIYLPLTATREQRESSGSMSGVRQGTETVLLAEDDREVRKLTRTVLEDFGYHVIEAEDGEEAIKKFKDNIRNVDMLLLDIMMPKKNGNEAYQEIRQIRTAIKVLFMSGYTAEIVRKKGILETGMEFILKPVSPTDLLRKVREVLDKP